MRKMLEMSTMLGTAAVFGLVLARGLGLGVV